MTIKFHRLVTPTYLGGLPSSTHDYINNAGGGTPAPADNQKSGGANDGTYFVGFQDDGTTSNVNRPAKALAQNCDFLDDVVSGAVPALTETTATAPGGGVSQLVLTGSVYVGKTGTTDNQYNRNRLLAILDATNDHQIIVGGNAVVAQLIHDGLGSSVVGSGFYTAPTVNLNAAIPAGTNYRLAYAKKSTLVDVIPNATDLDAFVSTVINSMARLMFTGGSNWKDATTNPAATVDTQLKKIITDLISVGVGASGAAKIGSDAGSGSGANYLYLTAGSVKDQLVEILTRVFNITCGFTSWTGGPASLESSSPVANLLADTTSGPCSANLPNPATRSGRSWWLHDIGGMAGEGNPITLNRYGTELINKASVASIVLRANFGKWRIYCDGTNWFVS